MGYCKVKKMDNTYTPKAERAKYYCPYCGALFDNPEEKRWVERHPYGSGYAEEKWVQEVCPECGDTDFERYDEDYDNTDFVEPKNIYRTYYAGRRWTIYATEYGYDLCFAEASINDHILDDTIIATSTALGELRDRIEKSVEAIIHENSKKLKENKSYEQHY